MPLRLRDRVALRVSLPEHSLRAGDVATLVDFVEHPHSGPRGCLLEVSTLWVTPSQSWRCPRTPSNRSAPTKSSPCALSQSQVE